MEPTVKPNVEGGDNRIVKRFDIGTLRLEISFPCDFEVKAFKAEIESGNTIMKLSYPPKKPKEG